MSLSRLKLIFSITAVLGCMVVGVVLLSWKAPAEAVEAVVDIVDPVNTAPPSTVVETVIEVPVAPKNTTTVVEESTVSAPDAQIKTVTAVTEPTVDPVVIMIAGPGVSKHCEVTITEVTTANKVMKQAAAQCHFSYLGKNYPSLGWFVDSIAGVASDKTAGQYWIYYVNNKKANVGVSTYQIQPGDTITWKYEQDY